MSDIVSAKNAYGRAREEYVAAVKSGLKEALHAAFEHDHVKNVVFGVGTAPYNDENAGQGTYGPLVNALEYEDGSDFTRTDAYGLFYDRGSTNDAAVQELRTLLDTAGWEFMAEALNMGYYPGEGSGEEYAFVARRAVPESNLVFHFERFDQGY